MTRRRSRSRRSTAVRQAILVHDFWSRQAGGGGGTPEPTIVDVSGASYEYRKGRNTRTIVIRGGRSVGRRECFMVFIEPDGTAVLHGLKQAADCALAAGATGRHLVEAAVKVAREGHARSLSLTDLSGKDTASGKKFRLPDMYFLTTGQTWYESVIPGLVPAENGSMIAEWRYRVRTNTWDDVAEGLRARGVTIPDLERYTVGIDTDAAGSAMTVLRRIKDAGTDVFADYGEKLLLASGIGPLYGTNWIVTL